jgi:hypothetical protein
MQSNWPIEELPGLNTAETTQLQEIGINTTITLFKMGRTPEARLNLANQLKINIQHISKWVALANLSRVPTIGTQYCGLLLHSGVISVEQLAEIPSYKLHKQIIRLQVATLQRSDLSPTIELVQQWSHQAKIIGNR